MKETNNKEIKFGFTSNRPKSIKTICDRCNGSGNIPKYRHIENGICFKCRGSKVIIRN
jgi:DnaJ-class molecular chaperone